MMSERKCIFAHPLIAGDFGCRHVSLVTRRDGPNALCGDVSGHAACERALAALKAAALPAFGVPDDLEQMPHSVPVKIQHGGLLGLARLLGEPAPDGRIEDVHALIERAEARWGGLETAPLAELVGDITAHKVQRRRQRGR